MHFDRGPKRRQQEVDRLPAAVPMEVSRPSTASSAANAASTRAERWRGAMVDAAFSQETDAKDR